MNWTKHITYLLYHHDCVILPGFGAFIANEKGVEVNTSSGYIAPRRRLVSFNQNIVQNDGLVAHQIAVSEGIAYSVANENLKRWVADLTEQLRTNKNVDLDAIGTLYLTHEEKLLFVPDMNANFSKETFGLPKVRVTRYEQKEQPNLGRQKHVQATGDQHRTERVERKRVERRERVQTEAYAPTTRSAAARSLPIVNALGGVFLIAMFFVLLNFELNGNATPFALVETAGIVDTPDATVAQEQTLTHRLEVYEIATAPLPSEEAAQDLLISLQEKYRQARIVQGQEGYSVSIITFSNQELASEYVSLLQHRINKKLVINTK